jgi:hypothetical protein
MMQRFADKVFTNGVKAVQTEYGVRIQNQWLHQEFGPTKQLTKRKTEFIQLRNI